MLEWIAHETVDIDTPATRRSDELGFDDLAVWSIERALQETCAVCLTAVADERGKALDIWQLPNKCLTRKKPATVTIAGFSMPVRLIWLPETVDSEDWEVEI